MNRQVVISLLCGLLGFSSTHFLVIPYLKLLDENRMKYKNPTYFIVRDMVQCDQFTCNAVLDQDDIAILARYPKDDISIGDTVWLTHQKRPRK